jgi:hypothetical protein
MTMGVIGSIFWFLWVLIWLAVTIFVIVKFIGLCEATERIDRNLQLLAYDVQEIKKKGDKEPSAKEQ